jgi:hypothetical protein
MFSPVVLRYTSPAIAQDYWRKADIQDGDFSATFSSVFEITVSEHVLPSKELYLVSA